MNCWYRIRLFLVVATTASFLGTPFLVFAVQGTHWTATGTLSVKDKSIGKVHKTLSLDLFFGPQIVRTVQGDTDLEPNEFLAILIGADQPRLRGTYRGDKKVKFAAEGAHAFVKGLLEAALCVQCGAPVTLKKFKLTAKTKARSQELTMKLKAKTTLKTKLTYQGTGVPNAADSQLVYIDAQGKLSYLPDSDGDTIPDFSNVGYREGGFPIPEVPVKTTLGPQTGDNTARIQAAIDQVSALEPAADGYRGTVLLTKGTYPIAGTLFIRTSGVVLRGEGQGKKDTVLIATGKTKRTLIEVNTLEPLGGALQTRFDPIEVWREAPGSRRTITDGYVPVGARSFSLESADSLAVGDKIIVHRPSTAEWIHAIGMDRIPPRADGEPVTQWAPGNYDLFYDRVIKKIAGNQITIDAPLVNAIEADYGGGSVYKYMFPERIRFVGIEKLRAISEFQGSEDEDHAWSLIAIDALEDGWVREVTGVHFAYSCVHVLQHAKWITVEDATCLDPVSKITGGRRYAFALRGQLTLVQRCYSRGGRHDFVMHSRVEGPNVFSDCLAESAHSDSGPHHRWATGTLYDNVVVRGNALNVRDRGNSGTGHGWAGAQTLFWNSTADRITCEKPPTAKNWAIGSSTPTSAGNCYWESTGKRVAPGSLYRAQLRERLH